MPQRRLLMARRSAAAWYAGAIAAYQPKGAASLAASYVNLANPGTYDAAPGVAPMWDAATGWTGTATSYLIGPSLSARGTVLVRFSNAPAINYACLIGFSRVGAFVARSELFPRGISVATREYSNGSALLTKAAAITSGVMAVAGSRAYLNGIDEGIDLGANFIGTGTAQYYILARLNASGITDLFFNSGNIQAVAIYDTTLSAAQVLSVSTAMAAL